MSKTKLGSDEPDEPYTAEQYKREYRKRIAALGNTLRAALHRLR